MTYLGTAARTFLASKKQCGVGWVEMVCYNEFRRTAPRLMSQFPLHIGLPSPITLERATVCPRSALADRESTDEG